MSACALAALLGGPWSASTSHAQTATAVEYRHSGWNHYFVTAIPGEIAALDGGAFGPEWSRTGYSFSVWTEPAADRSPVCRFFTGASFAPRSSHFYTPIASECAGLQGSTVWQYEGVVFQLVATDAAGVCAAGARALYRLYNNAQGGAPNHRYTTSKTIFDQMVAAGWTPEGYGPGIVFACVPDVATGSAAEGRWLGTSSRGEAVRGYVLDDGTFYLHLTPSGSTLPTRVLQGTSTANAGQFASADAKEFPITVLGGVQPATLAGTYVARTSLSITVGGAPAVQRTIELAYDAGYETPASLSAVAGAYTGLSGHAFGNNPGSFNVLVSGQFGGAGVGCSYSGTVTPRGSVNVFDFTLVGTAGGCAIGVGVPVYGIVDYDPAAKRFMGFTPFDGRFNLAYVIGTRP